MDKATTVKIARAGARLAARLGGLGHFVSFYDDVGAALRNGGKPTALVDPEMVSSIAENITRRLNASSELGRYAITSSDVRAASDAVVDKLLNAPINEISAEVLSAEGLFAALSHDEWRVHRNLGTEESFQLYRFLLYETCAALCRSFLSSPAYAPAVLTELLRRHDDPTLATWRSRQAAEDKRYALQWAIASQTYCSRVVQDLDRFEIAGIDVDDAYESGTLSAAFTAPTVARVEGRGQALGTETLLHRGSSTLLTSSAGHGKSSLLRYLAIRAADRTLKSGTVHDRLVPFHIKLRDVRTELRLTNDLVPQLSGHAIPIPDDFLVKQVESGHAALLLDGYDEVPQRRRREVSQWISALHEEYSGRGLVLIVTARQSASRDLERTLGDFAQCELVLMGHSESREYGRRWASVLQASRGGGGSDTRRALLVPGEMPPHRLDAFLAVAFQRPAPSSMHERRSLDQVVAMWSKRRDSERGIEHLSLGRHTIEDVLEDVALMSIETGADIVRDDLIATVESMQGRGTQADFSDLRPGLIADHVLRRTGIVELVDGRVTFRSRALQEYLAARGAVRRADGAPVRVPREALSAIGYLRWLGALSSAGQLEALLATLTSGGLSAEETHLAVLWACCAAPDLPEGCAGRFNGSVAWSIRTRGRRDAPVIARSGPRAVDAMKVLMVAGLADAELCSVVDVLSHTRCAEALPVLVDIASEARGTVRDTLVQCVTNWHDDAYAREVLPHVSVAGPRTSVELTEEDRTSLIEAIPLHIGVSVSLSGAPVDAAEKCGRVIDRLVVSGAAARSIGAALRKYPNSLHLTVRDARDGCVDDLGEPFPTVRTLELDARFQSRVGTPARSARLSVSTDQLLEHLPAVTRLETRGPVDITVGAEGGVSELDITDPMAVRVSRSGNASVKLLRLREYAWEDASWIAGLRSVESVHVARADRLVSLSCGGLHRATVKELVLEDCRELSELSDVLLLAALETVTVRRCPRLDHQTLMRLEADVDLQQDDAIWLQLPDWSSWFEAEGVLDPSAVRDPEMMELFSDYVDDEYNPRDRRRRDSMQNWVASVDDKEPHDPERSSSREAEEPGAAVRDAHASPNAASTTSSHDRAAPRAHHGVPASVESVTFDAALRKIAASLTAHPTGEPIDVAVVDWLSWILAMIEDNPISELGMSKDALAVLLGNREAIREVYARAGPQHVLSTSVGALVAALAGARDQARS